ncbi:MAG: hypothetical protein JRN67_10710 [Nitrososphaerota archaeon]|nr:hypothetical protein [Nitrososphaerota archaeon]MDG7000613.1 hypothetical protein [Nitrososphaerota archaeon]
MARRRNLIIVFFVLVIISVFLFAPVLYYRTVYFPSGEAVSYYRSASCFVFGFGAMYSSGHGHFGIQSDYYFNWNCPSLSTP